MDLLINISVFISTLGGLSNWVFAVMIGCIYFLSIRYYVHTWAHRSIILMAVVVMASGITTIAENVIGSTDPSAIVLDELVTVPFIFGCLHNVFNRKTVGIFFMGLILFGLYDRLKPFGIDYASNLPGGVGIVADDFAAAVLAALSIFFLKKIIDKWFNRLHVNIDRQ